MSIFGAIKHAIFGDKGPLGQYGSKADTNTGHAQTTAAAPTQPAPRPTPAPAPAAQAPAAPPAGQPAPNTQPVDVEQVLSGIAAQKGGAQLNWQSSIVDLLKLLDLDSSPSARKDLAAELNVHAGADGTAEQNIALHKAVMRELEKNGGRVPAALKD
jgi:3-oxoacyl-ACP reductase-like protein